MAQKMTGALVFDERTDRYDIRFDLASYYGGLHCGDSVLHPGNAAGKIGDFSAAGVALSEPWREERPTPALCVSGVFSRQGDSGGGLSTPI